MKKARRPYAFYQYKFWKYSQSGAVAFRQPPLRLRGRGEWFTRERANYKLPMSGPRETTQMKKKNEERKTLFSGLGYPWRCKLMSLHSNAQPMRATKYAQRARDLYNTIRGWIFFHDMGRLVYMVGFADHSSTLKSRGHITPTHSGRQCPTIHPSHGRRSMMRNKNDKH